MKAVGVFREIPYSVEIKTETVFMEKENDGRLRYPNAPFPGAAK